MSQTRALCLLVVSLLLCSPAAHGARETLDFEALPEGSLVEQVFSREGSGPVLVEGSNQRFRTGSNAAIIYDSSCPRSGTPADCSGQDADLGTPNVGFGGPGRGPAGAPGGPFPNAVPLGKVLIIAEDLGDADGDGLVDDPDDEGAFRNNLLTLDFSAIGPVTAHTISILEINFGSEPSTVDLFDAEGNLLGRSPYALPATQGNGVVLDYSVGDTEGVYRMVVRLQGTGAVDNIVFSPEGPRVDIETLTNGVQADFVDGDDVPWIGVGEPVAWTYLVTNTGTVPLSGIEVGDDRRVPVSCPRDALDPGESMECTASGIALDLVQAAVGVPTATGRCLSRAGRPLYANNGSVRAKGPEGVVVTDADSSHYCADPRPEIHIRKQTKGPDTQRVPNGSDATFEIVVWNRGTELLRDVKVADVSSPDCNREFSRLEAGQSTSYTCGAPGLAIGGDNVEDCRFRNQVVVTGRGDQKTVTDSDTSTVELVGLAIGKSFIGASPESAAFEVTVTNHGCDLDGVKVTDPKAPDCERDLGVLAAGDSRIYTCSMPLETETCAEGQSGDAVVSICDTAGFTVGADGSASVDSDGNQGDGEAGGEAGGVEREADGGGEGDGAGLGERVADGAGAADGDEGGGGDSGSPAGSKGLLILLLALLVGGGLFAWNRMRAG